MLHPPGIAHCAPGRIRSSRVDMLITPACLQGEITIPASKSHTIRALVIATLAPGRSTLHAPLISADTRSCRASCALFGATIHDQNDAGAQHAAPLQSAPRWEIVGTAGMPHPPRDIVDVGNSGTSMNFLISTAGLIDGYSVLSGDAQIKRRPVQPLLAALQPLGVATHTLARNGCPPVLVQGRMRGGVTQVQSQISQYLSSLLLHCPLVPNDTEIRAIDLAEKPYVEITLRWLDKQGIQYEQVGMEQFWIKGNQTFKPFDEQIPADFSSATFFLCGTVIPDSNILLRGLDFNDPQGDKAIVAMLQAMGGSLDQTDQGLHVRSSQVDGEELDLSDTPDALPVMAVIGCLAEGTTRLRNVAHARSKETDRIAMMHRELSAMGADIDEHDDGLTIRSSRLHGTTVDSHHDHRIAMALCMAGLAAQGTTRVKHVEAVQVTFPQFPDLLRQLGAEVRLIEM